MGSSSRATIFILIVTSSVALSAFVGTPFIHGEKRATEHQFPYLVSLRNLKGGSYVHICEAAILSERYVVTAAHCLNQTAKLGDYRLHTGTHMRNDTGESYEVKRFIVHHNFVEAGVEGELINDIALIETKDPIRLSEFVSVIEVERNWIEGDEPAIMAGWSFSEDGYTGLKYVDMKSLTNYDCLNMTKYLAPVNDFTTLCASSNQIGDENCGGDMWKLCSGGPLISNNKIIGIASWAAQCARGLPYGFSRISIYRGWIEETLQKS